MIKRIDTGVEASTLLNDLLLMHKIFTCVLPCCWMCVHFTTDCWEVGCIMWERIDWSFIPSQCRSFPLHKNIFHLCWKKKHPDCHLVLKDNLSNYWVILSVFLRLSAAVLHACIRVKRKYVQINSCVQMQSVCIDPNIHIQRACISVGEGMQSVCLCTCAACCHRGLALKRWVRRAASLWLIVESGSQRGSALLSSSRAWLIPRDDWLRQVTLNAQQKGTTGSNCQRGRYPTIWQLVTRHPGPLWCQPSFILVCGGALHSRTDFDSLRVSSPWYHMWIAPHWKYFQWFICTCGKPN